MRERYLELEKETRKVKLQINENKTKYMIVPKIKIENKDIAKLDKYRFKIMSKFPTFSLFSYSVSEEKKSRTGNYQSSTYL